MSAHKPFWFEDGGSPPGSPPTEPFEEDESDFEYQSMAEQFNEAQPTAQFGAAATSPRNPLRPAAPLHPSPTSEIDRRSSSSSTQSSDNDSSNCSDEESSNHGHDSGCPWRRYAHEDRRVYCICSSYRVKLQPEPEERRNCLFNSIARLRRSEYEGGDDGERRYRTSLKSTRALVDIHHDFIREEEEDAAVDDSMEVQSTQESFESHHSCMGSDEEEDRFDQTEDEEDWNNNSEITSSPYFTPRPRLLQPHTGLPLPLPLILPIPHYEEDSNSSDMQDSEETQLEGVSVEHEKSVESVKRSHIDIHIDNHIDHHVPEKHKSASFSSSDKLDDGSGEEDVDEGNYDQAAMDFAPAQPPQTPVKKRQDATKTRSPPQTPKNNKAQVRYGTKAGGSPYKLYAPKKDSEFVRGPRPALPITPSKKKKKAAPLSTQDIANIMTEYRLYISQVPEGEARYYSVNLGRYISDVIWEKYGMDRTADAVRFCYSRHIRDHLTQVDDRMKHRQDANTARASLQIGKKQLAEQKKQLAEQKKQLAEQKAAKDNHEEDEEDEGEEDDEEGHID